MLFGAKQPCRAHAIATTPEMSHAFEESQAFSIALKFVSQGAFWDNLYHTTEIKYSSLTLTVFRSQAVSRKDL